MLSAGSQGTQAPGAPSLPCWGISWKSGGLSTQKPYVLPAEVLSAGSGGLSTQGPMSTLLRWRHRGLGTECPGVPSPPCWGGVGRVWGLSAQGPYLHPAGVARWGLGTERLGLCTKPMTSSSQLAHDAFYFLPPETCPERSHPTHLSCFKPACSDESAMGFSSVNFTFS